MEKIIYQAMSVPIIIEKTENFIEFAQDYEHVSLEIKNLPALIKALQEIQVTIQSTNNG